MTKMQLKVKVITFAPPQLGKIPRLVACPLSYTTPLPFSSFFIPPPPCFLGIFGKVSSLPFKKRGGGIQTM